MIKLNLLCGGGDRWDVGGAAFRCYQGGLSYPPSQNRNWGVFLSDNLQALEDSGNTVIIRAGSQCQEWRPTSVSLHVFPCVCGRLQNDRGKGL